MADSYEHVNHPTHYNNYSVECLEMMRLIWGDEATARWCEMTAFKYRMRLGLKPNNPIEQDLAKEKFYLDYARKLRPNEDIDELARLMKRPIKEQI